MAAKMDRQKSIDLDSARLAGQALVALSDLKLMIQQPSSFTLDAVGEREELAISAVERLVAMARARVREAPEAFP